MKRIWFNEKKSMIYAEFFSIQMCYTIFKHMGNLKNVQRVEKYIHPALKPTYYELRDTAYHLRHEEGYFTTNKDRLHS